MLLTLAEVHNEGWTRLEHLVADLVEVVDAGLLQLHYLNTDSKGAKKLRKKPHSYDRPGKRRRRKGTTMGQLIAMTGAAPQHVPKRG